MTANELYRLAMCLSEDEKKIWGDKLWATLGGLSESKSKYKLEELVWLTYSCIVNSSKKTRGKIVAYGAGNMAKKHMPLMKRDVAVCEIWDAYTKEDNIEGIPIKRPYIASDVATIIIFIDDYAIRTSVNQQLSEMGYADIYYFREYLRLMEISKCFTNINQKFTEDTEKVLKELHNTYEVIGCPNDRVMYNVLEKNMLNKKSGISSSFSFETSILFERLKKQLIFDDCKNDMLFAMLSKFLKEDLSNWYIFAYELERLLRNVLRDGVKTKERPMRMRNDKPYDGFAVAEMLIEVLDYLCEGQTMMALQIVQSLRKLEPTYIPLMTVECHFLNCLGKWNEALELARKAMHKESNSLLANENFYQTALKCKKAGIYVEEPLPEYDLNEKFCWCGMIFAWCGGFDVKNERADFSPCFRPLQCAAHPEGEFWTGEDWIEFRKSLVDGSFRYCQKNQCSNLVAGWLPDKKSCANSAIQKILDGDFSEAPHIEELHFSYDGHCNLKCPSCRLEIQTMSKEQAEELDILYDKYLKEHVKKAKHLCLSGCGEAMISPHSKKILQSFNKEEYPELEVELRTNATTVNAISWEKLGEGRKSIRHIAVSIDAAKKETFEKLRYPAKWEMVMENLKFIQSLRNSSQIDMFEFHVVVQQDNVDELLDIVKLAISFSADVVTFSRMINWREIPEEEYDRTNPFWISSPYHQALKDELEKIEELRNHIENGRCELLENGKKFYINIHFVPDPNSSYDPIRYGRLKVR